MRRSISTLVAAVGVFAIAPALAQDASAGARWYLQLPGGVPSCVSCHGPDPAQNRNNVLRAADQPLVLQKTLNAVGAMGYLKSVLTDAQVADLAAYLGRVLPLADPAATLVVWPRTVEFGVLATGAVSPVQRVEILNRGARPHALWPPAIVEPSEAARRFDLVHDCGAELAPGASCTIELQVSTAGAGSAAAALSIGAPDGSSAAGLSATPRPLLVGLSATVRDAPAGVLSLDPPTDPIDFGAAPTGTRVVREVALLSHGVVPVVLGVATVTGPQAAQFTVGGCSASTVLDPGQRCTVRIEWTAGAAGGASARLQWRSDGVAPAAPALRAEAQSTPAAPGTSAVAPAASGGCSIGRPDQPRDPLHLLLAATAAALLWCRRRHPGSGRTWRAASCGRHSDVTGASRGVPSLAGFVAEGGGKPARRRHSRGPA